MNRVHQHQFAETAPLEALVDGQSSNTNCWQGGVARQSLSFVRRKINKRNARRRQRVIGRNLAGGGLDHDKTIGDPAADVLGHLRLEIAVENLVTATEPGAVMPIAERVEAKGGRGHATPNSPRYRLAARLRASVGAGGLRIAAAIWRWPSIERRMISASWIARHAASSAAATTKSVRVRPWISAARFRRAITSCGKRASNRAVGRASCFIAFPIYGKLPYQSMRRVCAAGGQRQALLFKHDKICYRTKRCGGLGSRWGLGSGRVFLRIPEQRPEIFLLKMPVVRENLGQPFLTHRLHRNAIDQAVSFIGTGAVELQTGKK